MRLAPSTRSTRVFPRAAVKKEPGVGRGGRGGLRLAGGGTRRRGGDRGPQRAPKAKTKPTPTPPTATTAKTSASRRRRVRRTRAARRRVARSTVDVPADTLAAIRTAPQLVSKA